MSHGPYEPSSSLFLVSSSGTGEFIGVSVGDLSSQLCINEWLKRYDWGGESIL